MQTINWIRPSKGAWQGKDVAKQDKEAIDPAGTVEISASASQLLGSFALTVLAGVGVAAAVWLNAEILTTAALTAFLIGTAGLVGLSFVLAKAMFRSNAPVVTISPEGVRDRRLSADTVCWRDIQEVRPRRNRQAPVIELVLSKEAGQGPELQAPSPACCGPINGSPAPCGSMSAHTD